MILSHACLPVPAHPRCSVLTGGRNYTVGNARIGIFSDAFYKEIVTGASSYFATKIGALRELFVKVFLPLK